MSDNRLEKLKNLMSLVNEGLTKEEFLASFKQVINQVLTIETKVLEKINKTVDELKNNQEALKDSTQEDLEAMRTKLLADANNLFEEQRQNLNFIQDKVRRIKEGKDGKDGQDGRNGVDGQAGKDADETRIINEILGKIELPELEIKAIKGLEEELKRLETKSQLRGGGFSRIHLKSAGGVTGTGTSHITVATTAPTDPAIGDLWVDTT